MTTERDRQRLERATQARAGTGVEIDPATVALLVFDRENADGTTSWHIPDPDADDPDNTWEVVLAPADLMRYGLIDRMRETLLTQGPGHVVHATGTAVLEGRIDQPNPTAQIADPKLMEGRTDDGWQWKLVYDEAAQEWLAAVDNKPAVEAHSDATSYPPAFYNAVVPVDVMEVIVRGARG